MNTSEIACKDDLNLLHEKMNVLLEEVSKLKKAALTSNVEVYLTSKEVMDIYKISKSHLTDLRIEGKIPYSKPFGILLYPKSQIDTLVAKGFKR